MNKLFETNWEEQLLPDEIIERKDGKSVLLYGLQRLSRKAGITSQHCEILTPSPSMVQAIYTAKFYDGINTLSFVGASDCSAKNTEGIYLKHPTAMAESRAEARCLRKALGIRILSFEEVGYTIEAASNSKVDSQIIKAIESLCASKGIEPIRVIEAVVNDADRASQIYQLNELTTAEGQQAMSWLNDQKEKVKTTEEKRTERKKELQEKHNK